MSRKFNYVARHAAISFINVTLTAYRQSSRRVWLLPGYAYPLEMKGRSIRAKNDKITLTISIRQEALKSGSKWKYSLWPPAPVENCWSGLQNQNMLLMAPAFDLMQFAILTPVCLEYKTTDVLTPTLKIDSTLRHQKSKMT